MDVIWSLLSDVTPNVKKEHPYENWESFVLGSPSHSVFPLGSLHVAVYAASGIVVQFAKSIFCPSVLSSVTVTL